MGPQHAAEGFAPAVGLAEQLEQPVVILRRIAPLGRLDAELALQQDILDCGIGRGAGDGDLEDQGRGRRMRLDLDPGDGECEINHGAHTPRPWRSASSPKKPSIARQASSPPDTPRQCIRIRPTSS